WSAHPVREKVDAYMAVRMPYEQGATEECHPDECISTDFIGPEQRAVQNVPKEDAKTCNDNDTDHARRDRASKEVMKKAHLLRSPFNYESGRLSYREAALVKVRPSVAADGLEFRDQILRVG